MKIIPSVEINHRVDFALLANARGVRKIVEVGTDRGVFARQLMERFEGELVCIDPYEPYAEMTTGREPDMLQAILAVQPWAERVRFLRVRSPEIVSRFPGWVSADPPVRLVYIDGAHHYEAVRDDIAAWWPFLPADGILAGHDYDRTHAGVMRAVEEFAQVAGSVVRFTAGDKIPSWYAYKTEPKTLSRNFFQSGDIPNPEHAP